MNTHNVSQGLAWGFFATEVTCGESILSSAEAQLTGEAMPYDIEALVAERNAMRAEINELEATNNQ